MPVRERLKKVFHDALGVSGDTDVEKLSYHGVPAWDSVGHMRLIAALETEFNVLLTTEQILDFSSFDQGLETLNGHGVVDC
jgi:acyl carrier protein